MIYCVHCGSKNDDSAAVCCVCNQSLDTEENLFVWYLIRKTKEKFQSNIGDSLYTIIKNFLLSHLFGVFVTISLVIVASIGGYTNESYIHEVRKVPEVIQLQQDVYNAQMGEISAVALSYINLAILYDDTEAYVPSSEAEVHDNKYQFLLDPSFGFEGVHEVTFFNRSGANEVRYATPFSQLNPQNPRRSISQQMMNAGYMVAELELEVEYFNNVSNEVIASHSYLVSLVKIYETWYVAEDVVVR